MTTCRQIKWQVHKRGKDTCMKARELVLSLHISPFFLLITTISGCQSRRYIILNFVSIKFRNFHDLGKLVKCNTCKVQYSWRLKFNKGYRSISDVEVYMDSIIKDPRVMFDINYYKTKLSDCKYLLCITICGTHLDFWKAHAMLYLDCLLIRFQ